MDPLFLEQIASILSIEKDNLSGELELSSCEWDSIAMAEFVSAVDLSFDIRIDLYALQNCRTVADLIDLIPVYRGQSCG